MHIYIIISKLDSYTILLVHSVCEFLEVACILKPFFLFHAVCKTLKHDVGDPEKKKSSDFKLTNSLCYVL